MIELCREGRCRKYNVNKDALLREDSMSFYLLGAFFADGHFNDRKHNLCIAISSKDDDWLSNIRNVICPNKPIYCRAGHYSFEFSDVDCMNWLISWGCTPRKSKTATIEKEIPERFRRDFFRGVVDGDGCLTHSKYRKKKKDREYEYMKRTIYVCSASEPFIYQLSNIVPSEIHYSICKLKNNKSHINGRDVIPKSNIFRIIFNDKNAISVAKWAYYENHNISLNRKRVKAEGWMQE